MTFQLWSHCSDWLGCRFGPASYRNSTEAPKSCPHFPTPGLFCDREAAVCLVALWTLWPTTTLGFSFFRSLFFQVSLQLGATGSHRDRRVFCYFLHQLIGNRTHVSTRHQGDREGWKKEWVEKKGVTGLRKKKSKDRRENRTTFRDKKKRVNIFEKFFGECFFFFSKLKPQNS